jgi:hypothetical protein
MNKTAPTTTARRWGTRILHGLGRALAKNVAVLRYMERASGSAIWLAGITNRETAVEEEEEGLVVPYPSVPAGGVDLRVLPAVGGVGLGAHHPGQLLLLKKKASTRRAAAGRAGTGAPGWLVGRSALLGRRGVDGQ